jgi:hypothetical protein
MCLLIMVKFVFLNFFHSFQECLEDHMLLLNVLIQNPAEMENKSDMEVLVSLFEDMRQLRGAMSKR